MHVQPLGGRVFTSLKHTPGGGLDEARGNAAGSPRPGVSLPASPCRQRAALSRHPGGCEAAGFDLHLSMCLVAVGTFPLETSPLSPRRRRAGLGTVTAEEAGSGRAAGGGGGARGGVSGSAGRLRAASVGFTFGSGLRQTVCSLRYSRAQPARLRPRTASPRFVGLEPGRHCHGEPRLARQGRPLPRSCWVWGDADSLGIDLVPAPSQDSP